MCSFNFELKVRFTANIDFQRWDIKTKNVLSGGEFRVKIPVFPKKIPLFLLY